MLLKRGVEISNGEFWGMDKTDAVVGFNLSIDAMDTQAESPDGLLRHENWWAGKRDREGDRIKQWGLLILLAKQKSD